MAGDKAETSRWRVRQARLTLLHAVCAPGRLGGPGSLATSASYEQTLAELLAGSPALPFELPWERRWSKYWEYMLGPSYAASPVSALAGKVVPLRVRPVIPILLSQPTPSGLDVKSIRTEGLIYPHAAVTLVSFDLSGDATLAETADGIAALAAMPLTVGGRQARLSSVAELATTDVLASCGFGDVTDQSARRFRVYSVLTGTVPAAPESAQPADVPPEPTAEWAAVRAITSLRPWKDFAAQPHSFTPLALSWGTRKLAFFNGDAVSYVLADNFTGPKSSNSCYHRNQLLLAAHLLALAPLVRWGSPRFAARAFSAEADRLVPAAAQTIDALTRRDSYRSALTKPLVDELAVGDAVASVLSQVG